MARLLKSFGVVPKNLKFKNGKVLKGYALEDFSDAFCRYLPSPSATALPALNDNGLEQNQSATDLGVVADENYRKPLENNGGSAVADRNGGKDGNYRKDNENHDEDPESGTEEEDSEWIL